MDNMIVSKFNDCLLIENHRPQKQIFELLITRELRDHLSIVTCAYILMCVWACTCAWLCISIRIEHETAISELKGQAAR